MKAPIYPSKIVRTDGIQDPEVVNAVRSITRILEEMHTALAPIPPVPFPSAAYFLGTDATNQAKASVAFATVTFQSTSLQGWTYTPGVYLCLTSGLYELNFHAVVSTTAGGGIIGYRLGGGADIFCDLIPSGTDVTYSYMTRIQVLSGTTFELRMRGVGAGDTITLRGASYSNATQVSVVQVA